MVGKAAASHSAEPDGLGVLASLYHRYYRDLVRLAALLTGDQAAAETVASDCLLAMHGAGDATLTDEQALRFLRRQAVVRSRRAGIPNVHPNGSGPPPGGCGAGPAPGGYAGGPADPRGAATSGFAAQPLIMALRALRPAEREAIVLVVYLELSERQAAGIVGLSEARLRRHLAAGMAALRSHLPGAVG